MNMERKRKKALIRAEKARHRAEVASAKARAAETAATLVDGAQPTRRRWPWVLALFIIVLGTGGVVARASLQDGAEEELATVTVEEVPDLGRAVVIADGVIDVGTLASTVAEVTRTSEGDYVLDIPIFIRPSGTMRASGVDLRLRSDAESVSAVLVAGRFEAIGSTVTSWDAEAGTIDANLDDGRAWISVLDNASMMLDGVTIRGLGYDHPERMGVAWIGTAAVGEVKATTISDGYVGISIRGRQQMVAVSDSALIRSASANLELASAKGVTIAGTIFSSSPGDGVLISGSTSEVVIEDSEAVANGESGFSLVGANEPVVIRNSRIHRNGNAGVVISNTRGVSLVGNDVWGNAHGISLLGPNADTFIEDNRVSGNRGAGVVSESAGTNAIVRANRIDHNLEGILVADGTFRIEENQLVSNGFGIAVLDRSPAVEILGNSILESHHSGIRLVDSDGLSISENSILRSEEAAFSVEQTDQVRSFLEANETEPGREGVEMVYAEPAPVTELAVLTPVPDYFFTPPEQVFQPLGTVP